MFIDKMSSMDRMNRFYQGKAIDRVPFMSSATMYAGKAMGLTSEEFYYDVVKSYEAQHRILEMQGCDGSPCYDLPNGEVLDFGGELMMNRKGLIELPKIKQPIRTLNEAIDFQLPEVRKGSFLNKRMEFIQYAISKGNTGVSISAGSPFTMVGSMVDVSLLLRWMKKEPEVVHKLLRQVVQYLLNTADVMSEKFGIENCSASANFPLENNDLISPQAFEIFSLPYIIEAYQKLKEKGIQKFSIHLCGNQNRNMEYFRELQLPERSFISSDEKNSLEKVAETLGKQYIYAGNVSSTLLVSGTPKQVYRCAGKIIEQMKYNEGGFILMPSCDLPINAKSINLYAMLKACRDFGCYEKNHNSK